jgi:DNA-binding transcriptional ArsR family regulator
LPISRPAVSQHLKILKDAGLLSGIAVLQAAVERFWRDALAAYKVRAEQKGSGDE